MPIFHRCCALFFLAGLVSSCSRDSVPEERSGSSTGCDGVDESCRCPDKSESSYICEDDQLLCQCEDNATDKDKDDDEEEEDDEDNDAPAPKVDASKPAKDAGAKDDPPPPDDGDDAGDAPPPAPSGPEPRIPAKPATCPELKTGNVTVAGQQVQLWVGAKQPGKKGPIMFYWHGTGGSSGEADFGLGASKSEILAAGGMIASFSTTTRKGQNTGNNVWYTGDFEMADQLLACAIEQQDIDPRRVYTAGCSAGGLQAGAMVYGRSSYLAGAMPNSGGTTFPYALEDAKHVPAVIATHGKMGNDVVIIDFATSTANMARDLVAKGSFTVVCDHGGGHCGAPDNVKKAQWTFLKEHPFGVSPEPYAAGLPADFPTFCKIITK